MPPPADGTGPTGSSRSLPRWLLLLAAAFLVARIATGLYEERTPVPPLEHVSWQPIAGAGAAAAASGKPILYDFDAEWCGPCQVMKREVFADAKSAQVINTLFHPVRVTDRQTEDGRNSPEVSELQTRYRVEAFPTLVVAAEGRDPIMLRGYAGKQNLMSELTRAAMQAKLRK